MRTLQQGLPTEQRATDLVAGHPGQVLQPGCAVHGVSHHRVFQPRAAAH